MTLRILVIALAAYLLLPQLAGLEASGRALTHTRWCWRWRRRVCSPTPSWCGLRPAAGGRRVRRGLVQRATVAGFALGRTLPGGSLAYVLGQWTGSVPLTPGGVGLVESATIAALVAGGVPAGVATASVLGWRLVSHWLPIVAGLALLPSLHPGGSHVRPSPGNVESQAKRAVDQEAEPR